MSEKIVEEMDPSIPKTSKAEEFDTSVLRHLANMLERTPPPLFYGAGVCRLAAKEIENLRAQQSSKPNEPPVRIFPFQE